MESVSKGLFRSSKKGVFIGRKDVIIKLNSCNSKKKTFSASRRIDDDVYRCDDFGEIEFAVLKRNRRELNLIMNSAPRRRRKGA